ncbi:15712_t:CDS:2, partial [Entrophospora sp. SA101]
PHGGAISEAKELKESKFYNSNILTETAGKTFTMNIKDFQEIKEQNPAENKTKQEKKTMRQGKGLSTNAKIGIAAVLVILRSSVETKKAISAINKQKTRHSIKLPIQLFSIIANHREIAKDLDLYALDEKTEVITPVLGNKELYQISGHLSHYQGYMFPEQRPRSYRELPFRLCENSLLFRYETSGALKGLERPRWFELADHHTFVNIENLKEELKRNYHFIKTILDNLNFTIERLIFQKGEAAFYGPKLDLEVKAADGKYITIATIQLDFLLPQKFNLQYIDKEQKLQTPIIIHQSPIVILPLNDQKEITEFSENLQKKLLSNHFRSEIWQEKTLNYRIKQTYKKKIPYYLVIGSQEIKTKELKLGKRPITLDTSLRLSAYFDTSPELWLDLQRDYELECLADQKVVTKIRREIQPWQERS